MRANVKGVIINPLLMIVGMNVMSSITDVLIDSAVDATADNLLSKAQDYINSKYPNGSSNTFMGSLITQMRMGIMARTQASFMMTASTVNGRLNQKIVGGIDAYKEKLKQSKQGYGKALLNTASGGKLNKDLRQAEIDQEKSQVALLQAIHQGTQASASESHSFGNGIGSLKNAYVTSKNQPLQQTKISLPELKAIMNAMGYYSVPQGV